jgi:predicted AlkP superfamily pyrophosphatase or phosphodiesterase
MRRVFVAIVSVALAATVFAQSQAPHTASGRPKLVVLMVVDQMRSDYVDRFRDEWTGGLKRLVDEGAWFTRAAYPYLTTVTCVGHATIATGALPHVHGIIQNAWYDRELGHSTTCTLDPSASVVSYGTAQKTGESARFLQVPTFADVMRTEHGARVATVSIKARSAIMLAGHGADAATWLSDNLDGWMTSSAFAASPVPAVASFVAAHPIAADTGKPWTRLLPESRYRETDDGLGEAPPPGWTRTFPHALGAQDDATFRAQWERSPYADAYVGQFAASLVDDLQLGRHDATDVLGVSFSSPDLVGHGFGPDSQEIHDMYAHLDRTIGALLDHLDTTIGRGRYVVALSADHGVTSIPDQLIARGGDAGRLDAGRLHTAFETKAREVAGPGEYVVTVTGNDIYLAAGMYEKLAGKKGAMNDVLDALRHAPGIEAAFSKDDVRKGATSKDRLLHAAALSYVEGRSGDIIIAPKRGWMFMAAGTTHGSASDDDQRVPILLFGAGIKHGAFNTAATPADIAPTLAALCGVTLPKAEGHALQDALARTPTTSSGR